MGFSDSHCHLNGYRPESLAEVLTQARAKGIDNIISVGVNLEASAEVIDIARSHEGVRAGVGIHPWDAVMPSAEMRRNLYELARKEPVVVIGEIGLDYARNPETKEVQKELLVYQLSLARETGLPVSVHCREAHRDIMSILRKEIGSDIKGTIHGFVGDSAMLRDWLELDFYVSIGLRSFVINEVPALLTAVPEIPLDRLLTETDAAGGGDVTGPVDVLSVVEKLASLRGADAGEIADAATANLKLLFRL